MLSLSFLLTIFKPFLAQGGLQIGAAVLVAFCCRFGILQSPNAVAFARKWVLRLLMLLYTCYTVYQTARSISQNSNPLFAGAGAYRVLGVSTGADSRVISRAYREFGRTMHPDKNPEQGVAEAYELVQQAYESVRDPLARALYNQFGIAGWGKLTMNPFTVVTTQIVENGSTYMLQLLQIVMIRVIGNDRGRVMAKLGILALLLLADLSIMVRGAPLIASLLNLPEFQLVKLWRASFPGIWLIFGTITMQPPVAMPSSVQYLRELKQLNMHVSKVVAIAGEYQKLAHNAGFQTLVPFDDQQAQLLRWRVVEQSARLSSLVDLDTYGAYMDAKLREQQRPRNAIDSSSTSRLQDTLDLKTDVHHAPPSDETKLSRSGSPASASSCGSETRDQDPPVHLAPSEALSDQQRRMRSRGQRND